jgi:uncharacterized LabA/DUF88 family protein
MSNSYAILLDGGFLRRKLGTTVSPASASRITAFVEKLRALPSVEGMRLHRIYYYDAKPLQGVIRTPLGGKTIDFGVTPAAVRNHRIQAVLHREPFFALRFGELLHHGWNLKQRTLNRAESGITIDAQDIEPTIHQKGVDMRIGLDIASLTLKRHVQVIVLVTADSDFVPAMKFARREGAQLFLVTLGHGLKEEMYQHADVVIENPPEELQPIRQ